MTVFLLLQFLFFALHLNKYSNQAELNKFYEKYAFCMRLLELRCGHSFLLSVVRVPTLIVTMLVAFATLAVPIDCAEDVFLLLWTKAHFSIYHR